MTFSRIIGLLAFVGVGLIVGQDLAAEEYPYGYRTAYALARGDTGIAVADDEEALFYNPAGLGFGKGIYKRIIFASPHAEVSQSTRDVAREIALQEKDPTDTLRSHLGKVQHVGVSAFSGIILRKAALGVYGHTSTNVLLFKNPEQGGFETIEADSRTDAGFVFGLGHRLGKSNFYAGATFKYIKRNQASFVANATDTNQVGSISSNDQLTMLGTGTGGDLGLIYRSTGRSPVAFGLTVQDLGNTTFVPDESTLLTKEQRPLKDNLQTVNLGVALIPGTKVSKFKFLLDFRDITNAYSDISVFKKIHFGTELTVLDVIGICGGLNQGYPTFGMYFDIRVFRIDVGAYTEEIGKNPGSRGDTRLFVKLTVGL